MCVSSDSELCYEPDINLGELFVSDSLQSPEMFDINSRINPGMVESQRDIHILKLLFEEGEGGVPFRCIL